MIKYLKICLLATLGIAMSLGTAGAQTSIENPIEVVKENIANLEYDLDAIKSQDVADMTKAERKTWRKQKRATRNKLAEQRRLFSRMTQPLGSNYAYPGFYDPTWMGWNPYQPRYWNRMLMPPSRVIVVQPRSQTNCTPRPTPGT